VKNYLVDAQLPPVLAAWLRDAGSEGAQAVRDVGLRDASDEEIWGWARTHEMVVVTKDADFAISSQRDPTGPQVVWLRLGNATNAFLREWFLPQLPKIDALLTAGERLVEVC
jgi:predicted nuclease of predicted toxin-antitoxin system